MWKIHHGVYNTVHIILLQQRRTAKANNEKSVCISNDFAALPILNFLKFLPFFAILLYSLDRRALTTDSKSQWQKSIFPRWQCKVHFFHGGVLTHNGSQCHDSQTQHETMCHLHAWTFCGNDLSSIAIPNRGKKAIKSIDCTEFWFTNFHLIDCQLIIGLMDWTHRACSVYILGLHWNATLFKITDCTFLIPDTDFWLSRVHFGEVTAISFFI